MYILICSVIQNLVYDYLILNGVAILTDEKMRLSALRLQA